jgi:hypothetical protein
MSKGATARGSYTLSATRPWTPHPPVWKWAGLSESLRQRAREHFEERAAIVEYEDGQARVVAELRAYCFLVEMLHDKGAFTSEQIKNTDVISQLQRAEAFRRHDAIGRCIMNGTWPSKDKKLEPADREALIQAAML